MLKTLPSTKRFLKTYLDFLFPPRCPLCFRLIEPSKYPSFCPECLGDVSFIEPPFCIQCGIPFASRSEEGHLCGRCIASAAAYTRARALSVFSGTTQAAIHVLKYQNRPYIASLLMGLVERIPLDLDFVQYDVVVPVPLHRNRLKQRGYNQSLLLGREIHRRWRVPFDGRLLKRFKETVPQIELTGQRREENVKGVFSLLGDPGGKRILLVDDVFTTGATVNECARVLLKGGANQVDVFTVARAI
jgi:ComF family protein